MMIDTVAAQTNLLHAESSDFDQHLDACIHAVTQKGAIGRTLAFVRQQGRLCVRKIDDPNLLTNELDRFDMVLFDGGNTHGDHWKHVFFPKLRLHCFIDEQS